MTFACKCFQFLFFHAISIDIRVFKHPIFYNKPKLLGLYSILNLHKLYNTLKLIEYLLDDYQLHQCHTLNMLKCVWSAIRYVMFVWNMDKYINILLSILGRKMNEYILLLLFDGRDFRNILMSNANKSLQ